MSRTIVSIASIANSVWNLKIINWFLKCKIVKRQHPSYELWDFTRFFSMKLMFLKKKMSNGTKALQTPSEIWKKIHWFLKKKLSNDSILVMNFEISRDFSLWNWCYFLKKSQTVALDFLPEKLVLRNSTKIIFLKFMSSKKASNNWRQKKKL